MPLITGTPQGTIIGQDEIYIEGAPWIYYQDYQAPELVDTDGFVWGLSGSAAYPVHSLACYEAVSLADTLTVNAIRCDKIGDKAVIQKRDHLAFTFSLSTLFPLMTSAPIMKGSPVTVSALWEKMGLGIINNNVYYHVYLPKVYDPVAADYVVIQLHRAQFVDAWTIAMPSGNKWMLSGCHAWALADENQPAGQEFATVIRFDTTIVP